MGLMDTDILVDLLRGHRPAIEWLNSLETLPALSGLALMEAIQGCRNGAEVRRIRKLVSPLELHWPTATDCNGALALFSRLSLSGGLGLIDSLIATTALGRGEILYSFNAKHFKAVPGLAVEQPYVR